MKSIWDFLPSGMWHFFAVLNFLSQLFVIIIAIGGLLAFVFRKFVGAAIDAFFKRRLGRLWAAKPLLPLSPLPL